MFSQDPNGYRLQISKAAIAVVMSCLTQASLAQSHAHPHHETEEIVVSADPLGAVDGTLAAPVTIITKDKLRDETMRSIGETVANQPGVTSSDFGASVGRPVIRGQSGGRVRVLEDGVGTLDISTISGDHGVSTESIFAEQVEILRGPATLLYGSGASGGLVNIVNGRIRDTLPAQLTGDAYVQYDVASDGWLTAVQADSPIAEQIVLHFDGLYRSTNDVDIPGFAAVMPDEDARSGTLENSDSEASNYSGGLSWVGDYGFIGFNISRLENEYGVPGAAHHHEEEEAGGMAEAAEEEGGVHIDLRQTRYDMKAGYEFSDAPLIRQFKWRFAFNDYEHDEIEGNGEIGTAFTNEELETRVEFIHRPIGSWDGVFGVQIRDKDFSAVGEEAFVPPSEVETYAAFLFEKADFNQFHIDAGIRLETQSAESSVAGLKAKHNLLSFSAGSTFSYLDGYEVGFNFSRTQRAPTIEELFAGGPHLATNTFEIGDQNLGEETSHNVDVFWRKNIGRVTLDFTVFYNAVSDYVFLRSSDINGDGVADRVEEDFLTSFEVVDEDDALLLVTQAQEDATFWGFEFISETEIFNNHYGELSARLWADMVAGELDKSGDVPRLPPWRVGLNLNWERDALFGRFNVNHATRQNDTATLETKTDAYTLLDLQLGYRVRIDEQRRLIMFARGTNLANETARRHTSFVKDLAPLAGRSGVIGVRLEF